MLSPEFLSNLHQYITAHYTPEIFSIGACREESSFDGFFSNADERFSAECDAEASFQADFSCDGYSAPVIEAPPEEFIAVKRPKAARFTSAAPQSMPPPLADAMPCTSASEGILDQLDDYINNNQRPSFSDELMSLIDHSGCKDSEIYTRAGIDRRHFSKIRSNRNYHPSKQTAMAFCLALRLSKDRSANLLETAGYTFSSSEIFDLVISYCIENRVYDLNDVNAALVYFQLKPIGAAE